MKIRYFGPALTTLAAATLLCAGARGAEPPEIDLRIRNHLFEPSELVIPAHTKVRLRVHNLPQIIQGAGFMDRFRNAGRV